MADKDNVPHSGALDNGQPAKAGDPHRPDSADINRADSQQGSQPKAEPGPDPLDPAALRLHSIPVRTKTEHTNLLEHWGQDSPGEQPLALQALRLDANEVAVIPFSTDTEIVRLHYVEEPEIRGYVHCNGADCVLCRAGRKPEERALLPVYVPATKAIAVLPISTSSRPGALRPQIMPILRSGKRVVLLITKPDRIKFNVGTLELKDGLDDGASVIKAFTDQWEVGTIKLASAFARLENADLAAIPAIGTMLRLKGLIVDEAD
jgi:hypothetical protein